MNTLVTGAAGFLGRRLVRELASEGMAVRCFLRASSRSDELRSFVGEDLWPNVEIVRGDLMNPADCRAAIDGIDVVHHAAAGLTGSTAVMFLNTVVPTRRLIAACLEQPVKRFVLVSSLGVYGAATLKRNGVLDESCPVDAEPERRDPYTYSKVVQEQAAWDACRNHGLPLVVIRPGVIYGPGRGALSNRIGLQMGGRMFRIGGGRQLPYVYVDHVATAMRQAGVEPGIVGEAFNVLDDELPSGKQVLRMYRQAGRRVKSVWIPQTAIGPLSSLYERYSRWSGGQLPGVITRYRTDSMWKPLKFTNTKARERLKWSPHLPFAETFQRSIAE
ncbi:3 beta-hydroxysteroid dehydrogenase/Delta 5--_4-isomerase [Caulifigura coniformis]|uniref:3 beta-hydroxysteroid dehydrogenase/Delta 5-->4-isomerase n=1 Tax=Caulifigura coniformis TaxID=2527983 RepID=A0A517SGZ7_9PLAN|nr:NAD-dependent epimerase/dehydratase family protein [Caulifigura coniformis]QDT55391.1 3 beta-hydroxysteroid dehydrogenase/Delta 5-->4-isomerase [Caulifigura coniformis]